MSQAKAVTGVTFVPEVMEHPGLVLVDFWGPGCGPCRMIAPTIDALAAEYDGRVKVVKVDVSQADEVANHFSITAIPTLMFFKNGTVVEQIVGMAQKPKLVAIIEENLA